MTAEQVPSSHIVRSADAQPADTVAAVPPLGSAYESYSSGASQLCANNVVTVKARALPMRCTECSASVFDLGRCACVPQYLTFGLCACARRCNDDRTCNKTLVAYDATLHVARSILQLANWHVRSPVGSCGHDTCSITHISTALAILHESCAAYAMHGTARHGTARHGILRRCHYGALVCCRSHVAKLCTAQLEPCLFCAQLFPCAAVRTHEHRRVRPSAFAILSAPLAVTGNKTLPRVGRQCAFVQTHSQRVR